MTIAERICDVDYIMFDFEGRIKRREGIERDLEICKRNLLDIREVLNDESIVFWLMYGTLLGAIRDDSFIKYDSDTDLGFFYESKENFHEIVYRLMQSGFELCRTTCNDNLVSIIRDDEYVDFAFFKRENLPFTEFKTINFIGVDFRIPLNVEELLTDWYGDWKIPVKDKHAIIIYGLDL